MSGTYRIMLVRRSSTRDASLEPKPPPKPGIELNRFNRLRSAVGLLLGKAPDEEVGSGVVVVLSEGLSLCRASTLLEPVEEPVLLGVW